MAKDSLRFLNLDPSSPVNCTCDILDKDLSAFNYVQYMFDRTNIMFQYDALPDTIPQPVFEYMLQIYGSLAILEHKDDLYAIRCNFGGPPDPYYRPTQAVVANPALNITSTYRIVNHLPPFEHTQWDAMPPCVRILNDSQIQGLLPLFSRYAWQLVENDISIRMAQINLRNQSTIAADTGPEYESAVQFLKDLEAGKLGVIGKRPFLDGITMLNDNRGNSNIVMQLIELQQYIKASWYNDVGLNSNFNMKQSYISSDEINTTADIMLPLVDNMYESRQMAVESINKQFGTHISVRKNSAWEKKQIQSELSVMLDPVNGEVIPNAPIDRPEAQEALEIATSFNTEPAETVSTQSDEDEFSPVNYNKESASNEDESTNEGSDENGADESNANDDD